MIDIIIPVYDSRLTLSKTLDSVSNQIVDCKFIITIVDDCSFEKYDDIISSYNDKVDIRYLRLDENSGSGVARQYGLYNTSGEYITFIDSDDVFYDNYSLNRLYKMIKEGYDVVSGVEYDEDRKIRIINEGDLHGKLYRRKFIDDNNIRFNNTRFHEDNYFNSLILLSGAKNFNLMQNVYIYCYNNKSITKIDKQKEFDRLEILLSNMKEIFDKITITEKNVDTFKHFIYIKYRYFNRLLLESNDDKKIDEKILVVYFSKTGENYNVGTVNVGNTAMMASYIKEYLNADSFEIVPVNKYSDNYKESTDEAKKEQNENARPEIKNKLDNLADYDTVFIGYPIWWGDMPMILYTFIENYDLANKKIIPFNTHEGSGNAGTYTKLKSLLDKSNVITDGLAITGSKSRTDSGKEETINWLKKLGY